MRVLVANRGEIAVRIVRACRDLGMVPLVACSDADRESLAVALSDGSFCIGAGPAAQSYLDVPAVLTAAQALTADAIHPGYGFLAESADFARACVDAGYRFVGPSAESIALMGDKVSARRRAESLGVPVVPGQLLPDDTMAAERLVRAMGATVMVKAAAGGGGRGMRLVDPSCDAAGAIDLARAEAATAFGDGTLYAERLVAQGRHVEIQVFGLGGGQAVALGERDCSVQRRHQKLVEESPSGVLGDAERAAMADAAVRLAAGVDYVGAGTVEFLWDLDAGEFYFLEMNTRLQVEHGVTELRTGTDLVGQQLRMAATGRCEYAVGAALAARGHVLECRVLAEDTTRGFLPVPGVVTAFRPPAGAGVRVDSHLRPGAEIPPFYDSMIAKVLCDAPTREHAIARMQRALREFHVAGVPTNINALLWILDHPDFTADRHTTAWFDDQFRGAPTSEGIAS
ncbi:MAG: acetyl-CoA carboxylase biotin carboxylase subunit [Streptosporangiales bacterium]|nr:acetyl-CoA carboxylase biotin carboxylase subunit [Streptosporangiales bacterium]